MRGFRIFDHTEKVGVRKEEGTVGSGMSKSQGAFTLARGKVEPPGGSMLP